MFGHSRCGIVGTSHFMLSIGHDHHWLATFFLFCATAATIVSAAIALDDFGSGLSST